MFKKKFHNNKYDDKKSFQNHNEEIIKKKHIDDSESSYLNQACCITHKGGNVLLQEFLCHLPISILALSVSIFLLILFDGVLSEFINLTIKENIYLNLFHISHYIHILFASFASFYAFSNFFMLKKIWLGIILAILNSFLFCTLADIILPTLGVYFLNSTISIHFCFLHYDDLFNALSFSLFGIFAAYCLLQGNKKYALVIARKVHLGHVWFGSISAILYLFSQIQINVISHVTFLFILLFLSVVIPCIFSDICMPYFFNLYINKKNDYQDLKIQY
jgi:hypothetical protein